MAELRSISNVVVIGGGRMGADITRVLRRGDCRVAVIEQDGNRRGELEAYLSSRGATVGPHGEITIAPSLDELTWADVDLVVECVPESLEMKRAVFSEVAARCRPDALITSNSSSLPISRIAGTLPTRERMLGWHFFYPADVVPVVEVIAGAESSAANVERLAQFSRGCRLVPIVVRKDVPGFVVNRLQHALTREAYALVEQGVVSLEDIDRATRFGFGFRYVAAGPFLQRDHGGLDVHLAAAAETFPTLANDPAPPAMLRERVAVGKLGLKSNEGFYRWSAESATAERARYTALLRHTLALLNEELEREYAAPPGLAATRK